MKKVIAVLIALAMVLSMSVMAFASFGDVQSPADICSDATDYDKAATWSLDANDYLQSLSYFTNLKKTMEEQRIYTKDDGSLMTWDEAWPAYLDLCVAGLKDDPTTAVKEIVGIVTGEYMPAGDVIAKIGEGVMGGIGGDSESGDLSQVISDLIEKIKEVVGGDKEPEVTADQYADELAELINNGASFDEITAKIGEDLSSGKIVVKQIPDIAKAISEKVDTGNIEDNETVQKILEFLEGLGGEGGIEFPDFGDITLPWDNDNSESGSFLDTILGIIGSIGDLFNPSNPEDPSNPSDPSDPGNTQIPDTGDVSFVAVAAVAAVAGAALVLTRKKSDAE